MSDNIAIRVKGLSKKYTLGGSKEKYLTFRDAIVNSFKAPLKAIYRAPPKEEFWALRDISFDVETGEVVGIIGRNGAGKSTLLKILSRITTPTAGTIELYGRVGALLEVGTGFHHELTGRENIYLSGSILGMKRGEIDAKLDEIIKFSELEKFLDTPVKRYSSGMYVRLAFAVAAHMDTEILLIDEVLAVGDAQFQKKCMGMMGDVAEKEGRTVLFVSHNMASIKQLCPSCIFLEQGHLKEKGQTDTIVNYYLESQLSESSSNIIKIDARKDFQLTNIRIIDRNGHENSHCNCDYPINIELIFNVKKTIPGLYGQMEIIKTDGTVVLLSDSHDTEPNSLDNLNTGTHYFYITIPQRTLGPGNYEIYFNFASSYNLESFDVDTPGIVYSFLVFDETSREGNKRRGFFSTKLKWNNRKESLPLQKDIKY